MKQPIISTIAMFAILLLGGCQHTAAPVPAKAMATDVLQSPWDGIPLQPTDTAYVCGPPAPLGPDITVTSAPKGVTEDVHDAVYSQSTEALADLTRRVVEAADTYRRTGSRDAAKCVITLLGAAADAHALTGYMASDKALQEHNRSLRAFAIAYLKVRDSFPATTAEERLILDWMEQLVHEEKSMYERASCGKNVCAIHSNKGHRTAMAAAAVGIAADDPSLFRWSLSEYRSAISAVNGRGMLHYDTRNRYAFKSNLESAASLVQIAEFAEANNVHLYDYKPGALQLLVHTVALGVVSPAPYRAVTHAEQATPTHVEAWEISWAAVYNKRFPDPVVTSLLQQVGPGGVDMWGGEPWDSDTDTGQ